MVKKPIKKYSSSTVSIRTRPCRRMSVTLLTSWPRKVIAVDLVFHATLLDSPEVNAFALPGGYVYITRGIMAYMNSEAELAGVLGHEIGHVTARHGVRQQSASQVTGILASVIGVASGVRSVSDAANIARHRVNTRLWPQA